MIRHLTAADYRVQPWANGRGQTLELAREDGPAGLRWRLSVAVVDTDGPFSRLPGIDRVLTVIDGPGFRLTGPGIDLDARPMVPVAFAGEAEIAAAGVTAASRDLNLMVARDRGAGEVGRVQVLAAGTLPAARRVAAFAPGPAVLSARAGVIRLAAMDLVLTDQPLAVTAGRVIAAVLPG